MDVIDRLLGNIKVNAAGCFEWQLAGDKDGYGRLKIRKPTVRTIKAHRLSWETFIGPIPDGLCVLHHCDNPCCINPHHLFLGTNGDNNRDAKSKGRSARGRWHPGAKLTDDDVREIRRLGARGVGARPRAKQFSVSRALIRCIDSGKNWTHVQ